MGLPPLSDELLEFHREAFVFDGHNDTALRALAGEDLSHRLDGGHLDLPRMREGGFDGGIFALWNDPAGGGSLDRLLEDTARFRELVERTPGLRIVLRPRDLDMAAAEGDVAVVIGVEGAYGVERADDVDRLHDAGVRCLTLTWMAHTTWADASGLRPMHGGLTREGRRILSRMERHGIVPDLSHSADSTARDVLAAAERPVIASHSGVRRVADHHRNLPDELLEGLARRGGVLGIVFFSGYLDEGFWVACNAIGRRLEAEGADTGWHAHGALARAVAEEVEPVPLVRLLEHFAHAISIAGAEHVGLGSDFDGVIALPEGLDDVRDLPKLTAALTAAGLAPAAVRSILGGNFRRILGEIL
ncbi:MAG: membrane dipeptidase [Gemmatimonadota bacterium]|nr:MAG: membrane dipeptidase [Gemmatimonadota bacterium]